MSCRVKKIYCLAFLFSFLSGSVALNAQSLLRFDRITVENGLSATTVHCFFQDDYGFMWIGTENGLNVYDGYQFRVYKHNDRNPNSISNNVIKSIFRDKNGTVWVGTENGLNRYLPTLDGFQAYFHDEKNKTGLTDNHIRKIVEDKKGQIWLATSNGVTKIKSYDGSTLICQQYPANGDNKRLNHGIIRGLYIDSKDRLWIGTDGGGMYKLIQSGKSDKTSKNEKLIHYWQKEDNQNSISSDRINGFAEDIYGNIWISTWNGGLNKLYIDKNGEERIIHYMNEVDNSNSINLNKLTTVFSDTKGYVWAGTYNKGINRAKINKNSNELAFESYTSQKDNPITIAHNTAYTFYEDRAGDIWIGTWGNGISRLIEHNNKILLFGQQTGFNNSAFEEIYSIDFDKNNNWWIGSWDGGLARVQPVSDSIPVSYNKQIKYFKHNKNNPFSISDNKVTDVYHDSKDRLWVSTWNEYLNVAFNISETENPVFNKIKVGDNAYFVQEDSRGKIWVGTQNGLYQIYGTESSSFSVGVVDYAVYKNDKTNPRSLPSNRVTTMLEDNKGNIWLGTDDNGIAITQRSTFDEIASSANMNFDTYANISDDTTSLSSNAIQTIIQTKNGTIWIGTNEGLNQYDESTNSFKRYTIASGHLVNDVVNAILEDDAGMLWLSTNRGITQLNPKTNQVRHYDVNDGLQGNKFIGQASKKDKFGNLYFGGLYGLNVFNPKEVKPNNYIPKVVLTDFKILNKSIKEKGHPCLEGISFDEMNEITVRHYENMLTFEFAALNFSNSEQNQYMYRLDGFDKNWHHIKNKREITFTNLDAGDYTLFIKGSNDDGIWSEEAFQIQITVLPPFWQTWWFRLLLVVLLGFGMFTLVRRRIKAAEKRNIELEKLVVERTKEIQKQKQLVEEQSKYKEQFFSRVSHELRTPLNGIIGLSHLMERTELSDVQHQFSNVIKDSAENLLVIVNDLLDISQINAGKLQLQERPFETSRFFNSLYELLRPKADQKNLNLDFIIDKRLPEYLCSDSVRLYQVLVNLLGNALKFTIEGHVSLVVEILEQKTDSLKLKLEVMDTGIGIPLEKLQNIFNSYSQVVDKQGYHYEGSGLGLSVVKNLVDLQNGKISVYSMPEEGSMFTVELPFTIPTAEAIKAATEEKKNIDFARKWKDKDVLLIEDNQVNLLYQKNLFIQWNLGVTVAKSITEAIKLLSIAQYDAIISDVKLPDGNGIDLIRTLQKDQRHVNRETPVIILSAGTSLSGARPKDINVEAFMTKPFMPEKLAEVLSKIFEQTLVEAMPAGDNHSNISIENGYLAHLNHMMNGNENHISTMVEIFLKQLPESIEKLDAAILQEDWESINYIAHHTKSTIQTIGLLDLASAARDIERASEQQNPNLIYILDLFEQFKQRCNDEVPRLQEEVNALKREK